MEIFCYIISFFLILFVEIYCKIAFCANTTLKCANGNKKETKRKKRLYKPLS
jgi:hypothetical protein